MGVSTLVEDQVLACLPPTGPQAGPTPLASLSGRFYRKPNEFPYQYSPLSQQQVPQTWGKGVSQESVLSEGRVQNEAERPSALWPCFWLLPHPPPPRHLQSGFANCSPGPTALTPLGEAKACPQHTISLEQG